MALRARDQPRKQVVHPSIQNREPRPHQLLLDQETQKPPSDLRRPMLMDVLMLQNTIGNRAVKRELARTSHTQPGTAPNDRMLAQRQEESDDTGLALSSLPPRPHYADLLTPSLSDENQRLLDLAVGGASIVEDIRQRDEMRARMRELALGLDRGDIVEQGSATADYERYDSLEHELSARIDVQMRALGVSDESDLLRLVSDEFPRFFLAEAKRTAHGMLDENEDVARSERERYAGEICTPDRAGLLAADAHLEELDPAPLELSIRVAQEAVARYGPSAGVWSPAEWEAAIPESQQSVLVEIANLGENQRHLAALKPIYEATRYAYGRQFPILLSESYHPGTFTKAADDDLGKIVGEPIDEILENIDRVREAINDDEMKVWNMRDVLQITQQRLGVTHPVLIEAIRNRIEEIEADESFLRWVKVALAVTTSVLAGMIFTPAVGMAVAAGWGIDALAESVNTYRNESAAENVALDPTVADISLNEPQIGWVILDAVFLAIDLGAAARALRGPARLLTETGDARALGLFRERAAAEFGDEVAENLTQRAARRLGLPALSEAAQAELVTARAVVAHLGLDDEAIVRIVAKGSDLNQVKGQLFEELMMRDVRRQLAEGGAESLGAAGREGLEVIGGERIADLAGRQLTDGILAIRHADGSLEIVTVMEAKAGRSAARGLASGSSGIDDVEEFARFVIEEQRGRVLTTLRRAGLTDDVALVRKGSSSLSDEAVAAIAADRQLRRSVVQSELGGQVRKDIERLAPSVDEDMARILVDGVPTPVRFSPTGTKFVGALPEDVAGEAIAQRLRDESFNFDLMSVGMRSDDVTTLAQQLIDSRATAAVQP